VTEIKQIKNNLKIQSDKKEHKNERYHGYACAPALGPRVLPATNAAANPR
jgi:hypothetical protein